MSSHDDPKRAALLEQAIRLKKATAGSRTPDIPQRPSDGPVRVSEMQRSLWLAHQIDRQSPAYNLATAFRVHGAVEISRLQRAFNDVVSRHRLLRSTFAVHRGAVLQTVHPHSPLVVGVLEVGEGEAMAAAVDEARQPFDLETGPLIRLQLIEDGAGGDRIVLLVLHHILVDERSLGKVWEELAEAYDGRLTATAGAVQFDDYLHWLQERDPKELLEDVEHWRGELDPLPEELVLPFEKPTAAAGGAPGRLLSRELDPSLQTAVQSLAAAVGATPFMVFAFAFRLLLQRYTDGAHVAFATPVSTRSHRDTADMIGYFTNPVVVATHIDEDRSVDRACREFSLVMREALSHASTPFQVLTEELSPVRRRDRHPIFQAMFVHQERTPLPALGTARLESVALDLGASKFDVTLFVTEGERSLELAVEYRSDRFDDIWMERLLGHFENLLEHLPAEPERPTAEVPTMSNREQGRVIASACGAELDASKSALLPQQISDQARRIPHSPAVRCGGQSLTYGELESASCAIAHALADRGVSAGDRVGILLGRSSRMVASILGTHWAGAAYVPLDPDYPEARNRGVLEDADVAAVLTTPALRGRLPTGRWVEIDVDGLDGAGRAPGRHADLAPESSAYILYTSGSTGRPKGVVVSHDNLRASTEARLAVYETPPRRFLLVPSVAFDSSVAGIFWTLASGGCLVVPTAEEVRDPRRLARLVSDEEVTGLLCVPSLHAQMLGVGADDLLGLETVIVAGESCPSRLVEEHFRALPQVRLFNEYGPTEATVWATVHEVTADDAGRPVSIGRPIPGVRVDVVDARGRAVPAGIPGSVWIQGPTVAEGYWRRADLSVDRFRAGGGAGERRYRTGDRMAWAADGRLIFLGREDEQIKLRGYRIEPGEVEASVLELPGVERAAVVARSQGAGATSTSDRGALQLVAFLRTSHPGVPTSWRDDLATKLPEQMIPSRLVEVADLPRLPNGKIDRQKLRDMVLDPEVAVERQGPVANSREQALISLWEGLLGRPGIAVTDNFFELGGHSLLVVEMAVAIEQDFEVELSAADVFENPTVRQLAERIDRRGGSRSTPYEHLFPIQPAGRGMPFIVAVPHFFTQMFAARFRGERPVYGLRGVGLRAEGNLGRWRTMRDLGDDLVAEIRRRFPDDRYDIAGYSFGASMAFETVRLMEERGFPVHGLYLIAPMPFDFYSAGPLRLQLDGLRRPVRELSGWEILGLYARSNNPLTRRPYRRAWRWLAIEPWRRLLCFIGRLRRLAGLPLTDRILYADVRVDRFRLHATYRPGTIQTPTVIFNAAEPATDAAATWRPFFNGPLTVHNIPDPHLGEDSAERARREILRHLSDLGNP